jgi:PAS domain S-box-containing protein
MEDQYRELLEAAPDAMVVVDQAGKIVLLNVQAEKQFGYRRDELLGQQVTNIIPEGFAERLVTDATRSETDALAQEIGTGIELSGRRKDGSEFPIEIMLSPRNSASGILVTAAIRNISVRKAAEKHLAQMEGQYRGLLEAAPDAMVVVDQAGEIVLLNVQAEKQFGYSRDELLGQRVTNIIPAGFAERLVTDATRSETDALAQEIGTGIELSGRRRDGSQFPIEIMLSPLDSPSGILVTAAIRNISVRKAADTQLAQMEGQYRGLLEAAPDAMVVVDQAGNIVLVNVQAEKQFGYRRDELLGQRVTNIIPDGFAERLVTDATRSATDALAQEIGTGIELSGRRRDGTQFPIEIMLSPLDSPSGVLVTAAIRNISVRKTAETHLAQMEGRYRGLLEAAPDAMVVVEQAGRIVLANVQAEKQFGYSRDELLGQMVTNIIPEGFAERLVTDATRSKTDALAQEIGTGIELSGRRRDGSQFPIEIMLSPLDSPSGILVTAAIRNISVRKAADHQLRQSQKMELVGQLTGGVAHDFNNILTIIMANADALQEEENLDPAVITRLDQIATAVQRAADLTRSLLAFSRKQALIPKPTDLNELVTATGELLRRALGEQVEIGFVLAPQLRTVEVDRAQIETALVNLCVNARDAMPGGGKLTIETRNVTIDEDYAAHIPDAEAGDYVLLSVTDNGTGMPPDTIARVFEPFFTTKEVGKGTGLGLSMVYGFIKQSNGHIKVHSEVGRGTSFKLYLPHSTKKPAEAAIVRAPALPRGSERILLVEDDPSIRSAVIQQLRSLGYTASEASNGADGLAVFESAGTPFDLLLTDVVMPGSLTGRALADKVKVLWPNAKVVFMSGYSEDAIIHHGRLDAGVLLLSKPFRKGDLAKIIRLALDGTGDPDEGLTPPRPLVRAA